MAATVLDCVRLPRMGFVVLFFLAATILLSICVGLVCGHIPILPTRVISVLGLKSTLENPQIQVYFAGNGLLAGENGWPFRRFCGGGGGLLAPLLAPRALILRTKQRLDALSRPTPPYFGHA